MTDPRFSVVGAVLNRWLDFKETQDFYVNFEGGPNSDGGDCSHHICGMPQFVPDLFMGKGGSHHLSYFDWLSSCFIYRHIFLICDVDGVFLIAAADQDNLSSGGKLCG